MELSKTYRRQPDWRKPKKTSHRQGKKVYQDKDTFLVHKRLPVTDDGHGKVTLDWDEHPGDHKKIRRASNRHRRNLDRRVIRDALRDYNGR